MQLERAISETSVPKGGFHEFCWYCGVQTQTYNDRMPNFRTRDHVVPASRGGKAKIPACRWCNHRKNAYTLEEFRLSLGGGMFWGELYSPHFVPNVIQRAAGIQPFLDWWALQQTENRNDWMLQATAAGNLRRIAHSVNLTAAQKRAIRLSQKSRTLLSHDSQIFACGVAIDPRFAGIWIQVWRIRLAINLRYRASAPENGDDG